MSEAKTTTPPAKRAAPKKKKPLLMKQKNMQRMIHCLIAVLISAIYFFGWRVLAICAVAVATGFAVEYITTRQRGKPVSTAVFVTTLLFGLALPPTVPWLVVIVGSGAAILFGKEVFGGFGRNPINPAILGRAFVYIAFPVDMTRRFVPAFGPDLNGWVGGFRHWSFLSWLDGLEALPQALALPGRGPADAVTMASPLWVTQEFGEEVLQTGVSWWQMAVGNIHGIYQPVGQSPMILVGGSAGEGSAVLILLCAVYLLVTKTANWRLMLGALIGLVVTSLFWRNAMGFDGLDGVSPIWINLLGGTTMYVLVFMITDPVTAPRQRLAQWTYAVLIGFLIVTLRWRGVFVAAATFSILLGNLMAPLLDMGAQALAEYRKSRAAARTTPAESKGTPS